MEAKEEKLPPIFVYVASRDVPLTSEDMAKVTLEAVRVYELFGTPPIVMIFCMGIREDDHTIQNKSYPSTTRPGLLEVPGSFWAKKCLIKFLG